VRGARRQGEQRRRRMGRAQRNPSWTLTRSSPEDGFRCALPIAQGTPAHQRRRRRA
jgi:hypothetical protein